MTARRIILADEMGYCWGVRRALDIVEKAGDTAEPIATIGDVIHNPQVVERLKIKGIDTSASISDAKERGFQRVAITAHGTGPQMAIDANSNGLQLLDTTCPLVTKVQRLAQRLVKQGYTIVVYGDSYHPEVRGVIAWADTTRAYAAKKVVDLPWNAARGSKDPDASVPPRKVAVVSQTTKNTSEFLKFVNDLSAYVLPEGGEIRVCNTICEPTYTRQNALRDLAQEADLILAIGGKKSSNTARLAEVGNQLGVLSFHIERPEEIADEWLADSHNVGITAGASTPDDVIMSVVQYLESRGFEAPEEGLREYDLEATPSF
ncbi:4-hydroxy-3-methylbut-2-enyl diphosphate reductase [soil metagenome]|jgi:4-hydroxy-3-methylbut-2-enyl diphosphate reductase|nr:4-hydroxy-3-methylbut-2-enyl diphosphate reductase [Chloroflexia bacterium]